MIEKMVQKRKILFLVSSSRWTVQTDGSRPKARNDTLWCKHTGGRESIGGVLVTIQAASLRKFVSKISIDEKDEWWKKELRFITSGSSEKIRRRWRSVQRGLRSSKIIDLRSNHYYKGEYYSWYKLVQFSNSYVTFTPCHACTVYRVFNYFWY